MNIKEYTKELHDRFSKYLACDLKVMPVFDESVEYYSFPATWSDTTCGDGGVGGQTITSSQVEILYYSYERVAFVSPGGKPYVISEPNNELFRDISRFKIKPKRQSFKYRRDYQLRSNVV